MLTNNRHLDAIRSIADEYRDLNGTHIEVLENPPSPLEFSRLVHISRPVIIKGYNIEASSRWTNEYLIQKMQSRKISVAITPNGKADAIAIGPNDKLYFVEPLVEQMTMSQFMLKLHDDSSVSMPLSSEVYYLQSQNGNLFSAAFFDEDNCGSPSEFEPLRQDVPCEIPWCSEALGRSPDAVNLWIGDSRSVTSMHCDPYENIYAVVRGAKRFTLLPPTDGWCLKEKSYPHATYKRAAIPPDSDTLTICPSPSDVPSVRWASISDPNVAQALPPDVQTIEVALFPGEILYLPVGWWHYVRQSDNTIALNWWYDAEMRGISWPVMKFLRGPGEVPPGNSEDSQE